MKYDAVAVELGVNPDSIIPYSKALQALYFKAWEPPTSDDEDDDDDDEMDMGLLDNNDEDTTPAMIIPVNTWTVSLMIAVCCIGLYILCKKWYHYNFYGRDGYKLINSKDIDAAISIPIH